MLDETTTAPPKPAGFDLAALDTSAACNQAVEIEIRHPITDEPLGVFISVLGRDSDIYQRKVRALANDAIDRQRRGKGPKKLDEAEDDNIAALAAVTTGWRNVVLHGEELAFSVANARKLYTAVKPIREQVQEAVNDLENFLRGSDG